MPAENEKRLRFSATPLKSRIRRSARFRYSFAILLACLAAGAQFLLEWLVAPSEELGSYQFFLGATALSALWTGRFGGFVTLLTSSLFKLYYFLPPPFSFRIESHIMAIRLVMFVAMGV